MATVSLRARTPFGRIALRLKTCYVQYLCCVSGYGPYSPPCQLLLRDLWFRRSSKTRQCDEIKNNKIGEVNYIVNTARNKSVSNIMMQYTDRATMGSKRRNKGSLCSITVNDHYLTGFSITMNVWPLQKPSYVTCYATCVLPLCVVVCPWGTASLSLKWAKPTLTYN